MLSRGPHGERGPGASAQGKGGGGVEGSSFRVSVRVGVEIGVGVAFKGKVILSKLINKTNKKTMNIDLYNSV